MSTTKVKLLDIIHNDDSDVLILENLWIPQEKISLNVTSSDYFKIGDILLIEIKESFYK